MDTGRKKGGCCPKFHGAEPCAAWMLLFWVFIHNALMSIYYASFGLLYIEYSNYFMVSKADIGWIIAIEQSFGTLTGMEFDQS